QGKTLPTEKKGREIILKQEFKKALKIVSKKLGHDEATLRGQYLLESFEDDYMKTGKPSIEKIALKVALKYAGLFDTPPKILDSFYKAAVCTYSRLMLFQYEGKSEILNLYLQNK